MASNMFILINSQDGGAVQGESVVADYKNQIEVTGVQWGVAQTGSAHSGLGGSTGTATVDDVTITASVDKSFPILAQMAHTGAHIANATLTICKTTGGKLLPYLVIKMTGGLVSRVSLNGSTPEGGTSVHTMLVSLNFSQVEFDYTPQTAAGQGGAAVTGKLDIAGNA